MMNLRCWKVPITGSHLIPQNWKESIFHLSLVCTCIEEFYLPNVSSGYVVSRLCDFADNSPSSCFSFSSIICYTLHVTSTSKYFPISQITGLNKWHRKRQLQFSLNKTWLVNFFLLEFVIFWKRFCESMNSEVIGGLIKAPARAKS